MAHPLSPRRPRHDKSGPRHHHSIPRPPFSSRDTQDMVSLLVSAVAGALTAGAIATLIIMSPPAFAGTTGTDGTAVAGRHSDAADRPYLPHAVVGNDRAPLLNSGPRSSKLPPVCSCALPQPIPD